jgi:dTDP-4-dehydrorhamnose reductase
MSGVDRSRVYENIEAANVAELTRVVGSVQPDVIVNCIGLIKQLPLANDPLAALEINALLPHRLAHIARAARARLIHFSTDCVFSGKKTTTYTEDDQSDAEDLYGRSKFMGEVSYGPHTLTLRTSIIGRELYNGYGLVEWFLSQTRKVKGYQRAIFSGFTTGMIAKILMEHVLPNPQLTGLYHLSSEPISKYDLLQLINRIYGCGLEIASDTSVVCNRALDSRRFRATTGFKPPIWPEMVQAMHHDPIPYGTWKT